MIFVFDSKTFGTFWWCESLPDFPDEADRIAAYEQIVSEDGAPGVTSTASIVKIRDGDTALLGEGTIEWVHDTVQFVVEGRSFTSGQAIEIANTG